MPDEERIRELERALSELRRAIDRPVPPSPVPRPDPPPPVRPEPAMLAHNIEIGEKMIERVKAAKLLREEELQKFENLARGALQDRLRDVARGIESVAAVHCSVSGCVSIAII